MTVGVQHTAHGTNGAAFGSYNTQYALRVWQIRLWLVLQFDVGSGHVGTLRSEGFTDKIKR